MLRQTLAITMLSLRSIPERLGPSLVIVVGLAGVVAVFTALLAMAEGFQSTLESTGRADIALVLRGGSSAELNSGLSRDQATLIKQAGKDTGVTTCRSCRAAGHSSTPPGGPPG